MSGKITLKGGIVNIQLPVFGSYVSYKTTSYQLKEMLSFIGYITVSCAHKLNLQTSCILGKDACLCYARDVGPVEVLDYGEMSDCSKE